MTVLITNKKAEFNFEIIDRFEAGIILSGDEVRAIRVGKVDFTGSYVKIISGEMFVINLHIGTTIDPRRTRKLLVSKAEILLCGARVKEKKLVFLPLSMYNKGRLIKLEVALARGKRQFEKRETLKQRDIQRNIDKGTY